MKKNNVRIKENISFVDEINAIKSVVGSHFTGGNYTPYYRDRATVIAIVENFIDGIEFEDNETIYDSVCNDEEIMNIIYDFRQTERMQNIDEHIDDIVYFERERFSHYSPALETIAEFCNVITDTFTNFSKLRFDLITPETIEIGKRFIDKFKNGEITEDSIANAVSEIIKEQNLIENHKMPETEIYEQQRLRIEEQQKMLEENDKELKELRKHKKEHSKK